MIAARKSKYDNDNDSDDDADSDSDLCRNNVVQFSNSLLGSALGQGVVAKI